LSGQGREGDNLWTCSIVALNPDTGKLAWYFQASPHDTHDWDAVQVARSQHGSFTLPQEVPADVSHDPLVHVPAKPTTGGAPG